MLVLSFPPPPSFFLVCKSCIAPEFSFSVDFDLTFVHDFIVLLRICAFVVFVVVRINLEVHPTVERKYREGGRQSGVSLGAPSSDLLL